MCYIKSLKRWKAHKAKVHPERDCKRNFKWPSACNMAMTDLQRYPINMLVWSNMNQICMCLFIKTDYFHLWILCQKLLAHCLLIQKMMLSSTFLIRLRFQGRSCINRALLSLHGGSFKITCTIPLICLMKIKLVFSSLTHSKKFQIFI